MQQRKVLVIGSANMDLVTRIERQPRPGETLIGRSFATVTGGKGANQAVAAARLGGEVAFLGCVGDDAFGAQQRESLAAAGVDIRHLKVHPTEATGTAVILVADEGQNVIIIAPGANAGLEPEDIFAAQDLIGAADVVLLQLELRPETVLAALEIALDVGVLSVLDAGPAQALDPRMLRMAAVVSPNETEAEDISGLPVQTLDEARAAAAHIRGLGAREVVLKLEGRGALYFGGGETLLSPPFDVDVVDTTAAGDAFTAALALCWGLLPTPDALRFANAAGALAVTRPGAQPAMPSREAVDSFLRERS